MEEKLRDINIQVLEIKYVIKLGKFLRIMLDIKQYIFKPIKSVQPMQPELVHPKPTCVVVIIDHQMAMIQVQVGKNFIADVLIDGGYGVNIIIENVRVQLGMLKLDPTPYNMCMVDQIVAKPFGLTRDLKIFAHGIPCIVTFTIINNNVIHFSYSMLLGRPWLKDAKVSHNWEIDIIIIKGILETT